MKEQAQQVLIQNKRNGYTIPSPKLYPFQWSWDSGFIALGLSHFDKHSAFDEIRSMFKGQWSNGMLPHINFHKEDPGYFPGPEVWGTKNCQWSPQDLGTSGITQPPVFGFILGMMTERFEKNDREFLSLLKEIYPKIKAFHSYLYNNRDPYNEGLVYISHNWESGTDNSPLWDDVLERMDVRNARDVAHLRRDLKTVDASQRPTNENYKRYIYLVDMFRNCNYDDAKIFEQTPFAIQDVLFNSMLIRSNEGLIKVASFIGEDASEIVTWNQRTITGLNHKCWNEEDGFYYDFDMKANMQIRVKVSNSFMPLFAGACSPEQAEKLKATLVTSFKADNYSMCSSSAVNEITFNPVKYWRGPIWINLNWMLHNGLKRYGFDELAQQVKRDSLQLVEKTGFYEYFDPRAEKADEDRGLGGNYFSWTAALYLDFITGQ